ncbi:Sterol-sensing multi-domain protein [Pyrenophora tritici-repentis]|nr:Sterol-sensing multi-domain protein [Pyrenophora tritici-repentis]
MAKTKPADRRSDRSAKNGTKKASATKESKKPKASPEELLIQATALLQTSQPEEALVAARRALNILQPGTSKPSVAVLPALNLLGEINVELGDPDSAREAFQAAVVIDPEGTNDGAEKFLWLAQLNEEGGAESVRWFEKGIAVLKREISELEGKLVKKDDVTELLEEKRQKIANSLCGIAEVYMTDLSWEEDAEARCNAAVTEALLFAPENPEPLQTLASIRISQLKPEEAKSALLRSMELWKDLDPDDAKVPDYSTRISLSRLLMEAEMEDEAIEVLERLVGENDGSVEAWYLGGWCLHLLAGKQKTKGEEKVAMSLLRASRDWLENCLKLYGMLEYEDERLKEHADELLKELGDVLGPTTEPPRLAASHPIRRAFQAHGTAAARHWLLSIGVTITISVLLCYQAIFQPDSSAAAGLRNLPKHVWTSTTQVDGDRPADVVVRQVWVHGDYMKAIQLPVLHEAMHVQEVLVNGGFDSNQGAPVIRQHILGRDNQGCVVAAPGEKWGWHSPLMYWNCSLTALDQDQDLLGTINAHKQTHSALNLTLRPSTVFAGKSFSNSRLRAADALVITLFDQTNSTVGDTWNSRAHTLAETLSSGWTIFPPDGHVTQSRLYEFRFKPMTLNDDLFLAASYLVTAVYVIWRMMQLRAVKSWFGLLVTVVAKMTICIIASFTLCTYLGIDLARIPRPWFPGVVFCFGLGNIFRLINVVLQTPPEMSPHQRIGNALGEVGHLSLAIAFQNLALLYVCSRFVSPWVADFCVFAAVTLVFDLVFHLTFFVAVLSVDVQRLELSDSLERIDRSQSTLKSRAERQSWLGALKEGTMPLSTRFAGTAAIFSIILAINWHFFDGDGKQLSLETFRESLTSRRRRRAVDSWSPPPINQARTPADWLRLQDHNTARELFSFIKPGAQTFVACIYDPILVVAKGAIGRDRPQPASSFIEKLRRFAQGHAFPAALIVVTLIAGVTLLMNYLLWTGLPKLSEEADDDDETSFSVKTLPTPQTLDVAQLTSCPKGHLVSVSFDRSTAIWLHSRGGYLHTTLQTAAMKPELWPIHVTAMDRGGNILAICAQGGQIGLWDIPASRFLMFPKVEICKAAPVLFAFVTLRTRIDVEKQYLIIVSPDGQLTKLEACTGIHNTRRISASPIVCTAIYTTCKSDSSLVFVNKLGEVHILSLQTDGDETSEVVAGLDPGPPPGSNPAKIQCIQAVPSLGMIFALRDEEAEVFDFTSRALVHAFQIGHVQPHSFRVLHSVRRSCKCGAPAVNSLSVAYTEQDTSHMIMQTFTLDDSTSSQICFAKPLDRKKHGCRGLEHASEAVHYVEPVGTWESTDALSVIGIRRCIQSPTPSTIAGMDEGHGSADVEFVASALKQRALKQGNSKIRRPFELAFTRSHRREIPDEDTDTWEAWTLSTTGEFRSRPLAPDDIEDIAEGSYEDELFAAAPGPITRLGKRSVAVGLGNRVKIITLGKECFDGLTNLQSGAMDIGLGPHKWRSRQGDGRKVQ